jgi:hypothetical protein
VGLDIDDHTELIIDTLDPYENLKILETLDIYAENIVCKVNIKKLIKLKVNTLHSNTTCDHTDIVTLSNPYVNTMPLNVNVTILKSNPTVHVCKIPKGNFEIYVVPDGLYLRFEFPRYHKFGCYDILITPGKYFIELSFSDVVFRGSYVLS